MIHMLTKKAYAKINLYLHVKNRRADGYHEIETVMQQVSLFDYVTVVRSPDTVGASISILCTDKSIPEDERNIAYKCAAAFFRHHGIENYNVTIHIDKRIPSSAGLAGGSSDGAAVLCMLHELFTPDADRSVLREIGAKVGADIPFCLTGGVAVCTGIGEQITRYRIPTPSYHILIASPGDEVSTAKAYSKIDELCPPTPSISAENVIEALESSKIPSELFNSFESVIEPDHPRVAHVKSIIKKHTPSVMMSGSGPSVFGLFRSEDALTKAMLELLGAGYKSYRCTPV